MSGTRGRLNAPTAAVGALAIVAIVLASWALIRDGDGLTSDATSDPSPQSQVDRADDAIPATPAAPTLPPLATPTPEPTVLVPTDDLTGGIDFEIEVATSLFGDPSAEQPDTDGSAWNRDAFGDLTAAFSVTDQARSGSQALRVDVTDHVSGDAKWFPDPIGVEPGGFYEFSHHYTADVDTEVWLVRYDTSGAPAFDLLEVVPRAGDWRRFGTEFLVPAETVAVTIFHVLKQDGTLVVDDYALGRVDEPLGFARGLATITFDDTWTNDGRTLFTLAEHGFIVDLFVATDIVALETADGIDRVRQFLDAGHGVGSHSVTHRDLTTLTTADLEAELVDSIDAIADTFGREVTAFASPFGVYNTPVLDQIARRYDLHRTTNAGFNTPTNLDPLRIKVQNVRDTTAATEVEAWAEAALARGWWLVLVYHDVTDDPGPFDTTPEEFARQMEAIAGTGITVLPLDDAWAELESQLG
ncbi:MAG: polysaccharide deacetylase family protein [Actinomycetota bacterium]